MIAIDTSVLIDLLGDGNGADAAEACLRLALGSGPVGGVRRRRQRGGDRRARPWRRR